MSDWMNFAAGAARAFVALPCLVHGLALADDDPALAETSRRLGMSIDIVRQHHRSGCESGRPNEQFICASYRLVVEEQELAQVRATLVSELAGAAAQAKLAAAQEAWVGFRDRACDFEADGYAQARDLASVVVGCKATYTHARTAQLKRFLGCGQMYGCPGSR
jgi:uncharacterized protein YecT (DUF1311 family)